MQITISVCKSFYNKIDSINYINILYIENVENFQGGEGKPIMFERVLNNYNKTI